MTSTLLVGTRKGLFTLTESNAEWSITDVSFLGEPVSVGLVDADGTTYAALGTGHFGAHLWRKEAGGEWSEAALPDGHAYDLVYRHCLDVDASGDRLVMGSTTGSLWCSDIQRG